MNRTIWSSFIVPASATCVGVLSAAHAQSDAVTLRPGVAVARIRTNSEPDVYTLRLESGAAASVEVDQQSVHVRCDVTDPTGHLAATFESPSGGLGVERFVFTALKRGTYHLSLSPAAAETRGTYSVRLAAILDPIENAKRITKAELLSDSLFVLWEEVSRGEKGAVTRFLNSRKGVGPLIEPIAGDSSNLRVTYLFAGDSITKAVRMCGGPRCAVDWMPLTRFMGSSLFYASEIVPRDARYRYHFLVTEEHRLGPGGIVSLSEDRDAIDSLNPNISGGLSTLALADAPPEPYIGRRSGAERGNVALLRIHSNQLKVDRDVAVYTPPGYDSTKHYNLLIVFDGEVYGADSTNAQVPMPTILDNMIADGKIGPTLALLIPNVDRTRDLGGYRPFSDFVATELIPWARAHYNIWPGPSRIVLAGSSRGGHAATYIALAHPDAVGNVLSQSGAYWIRSTLDEGEDWPFPYAFDHPALIDEIRQSPRVPIRFYLEVGRFDSAVTMVPLNRELRDLLIAKGYDVTYHEFDGGHNYFAWRGSISNGLIALLRP